MLKIFLFLLIILIMVILESIRENRTFQVKSYDIRSDKLKSDTHVKAVFISDFHDSEFGRDNRKLLNAIDRIYPDFILLGGDMPVGSRDAEFSNAVKLINSLAERYTVYYGMGNHEKRLISNREYYKDAWDRYYDCLDKRVIFMCDRKEELLFHGDKISIYSLDIDREYYKRFHMENMEPEYIEKKLGKPDDTAFNILLAHNPDYFPAYAGWGADLSLSGHLHGGLVRIPFLGGVVSPRIRLFPQYDKGMYDTDGKKMLVSPGLGEHSVKLRINNIPQLLVINILNKD